jgi:hypothetical protein
MGVFLRAVVTGFGFSLGAAMFKRVSARLGLDEDENKGEPAQAEASATASDDGESNHVMPAAEDLTAS